MNIYNEIIKSTDVGINAINNIRTYIEDEEMMHKVLSQRESMKVIQDKVQNEMSADDIRDAKGTKMQQAMVSWGTKWNAMMDKSNTHIAEMLIEGTNMGINSITEAMNDLKQNNEVVPPVVSETLQIFQNNINELRSFL